MLARHMHAAHIVFGAGDRAAGRPAQSAEVGPGTGEAPRGAGPLAPSRADFRSETNSTGAGLPPDSRRKVCLPGICIRRISFSVLAIALPGALIVGGGRRPAANVARAFAQALGRDLRTAIIRDHLERPETPERGPTTLIDHMKAPGRRSDDSSTVEASRSQSFATARTLTADPSTDTA
jgi:hypothetical protein